MSGMNPAERERKKRQLRRRVIEPGASGRRESYGEKEEDIVRRAERRTRRKRMRAVFFTAVVLACLFLGLYGFLRTHQYTDYTVVREKEIPASESSFTEYVSFGENILRYTKDGASYIDGKGNTVWSLSYQLKAPICYVNGEFAAIADQQGNEIYICDQSGCQGQASTALPILRVSVSAYGVAAALVEDSTASYITFFKKDGSTLDWAIKTAMTGSGYLMDVSLSPDGTQVMVSDLYLRNGALQSRVVFYNFSEFGKNYPDRLVGGFDEFGGSICPRVRILNEGHACAFADGRIAFFSLENVTSPELTKIVTPEEKIQGIAYSDEYVAAVTDCLSGANTGILRLYRADGTELMAQEFTYPWEKIDIDGNFVILYNDKSCRIYSIRGREKFSGEFDFPISKITRGPSPNTLLVTGGNSVRELRLK